VTCVANVLFHCELLTKSCAVSLHDISLRRLVTNLPFKCLSAHRQQWSNYVKIAKGTPTD